MKRSTFLRLSAFGAAGLAIPFLNGCGRPVNKAMAEPMFLQYIFDAKTIKETGLAYLQQTPSENSKNKLVDLLTEGSLVVQTTGADMVHSYFDTQTKHDFKQGKTVVVNGWILSQTEARQCALFCLLQ